MGSYYHLASQLPYLVFGQKPPMTSAAFILLAKSLLNQTDAALIDLIALDPEPVQPGDEGVSYANSRSTGSDFIDGWRDWERALRLNMARQRAIKIKRDSGAPVEPPMFPTDAAALAVKAISAESPLEGEMLIDRARWSAIEVMQGGDNFHRNTVYAYLLKLLLLERQEKFNAKEGFDEYKSLYASIMEGVQSGISPVGEPK